MGTCAACNNDMNDDPGCTEKQIVFVDGVYDPVPVGEEDFSDAEIDSIAMRHGGCADCGAEKGETHHPGCDWERCPRCNAQLLSCNCSVFGHQVDGEDGPRFDRWGRELVHGG